MKKPKLSKNHHYVPKAILREFCFRGDSIFRLDCDSTPRVAEPKNIDRVFQRFHLNNYSFPDGKKDDTIEKFFGKEFDNFLPDWIRAFTVGIENRTIEFPDHAPRIRFVHFFYYHMKRNPDFIDPLVESVANEVFHPGILSEIESKIGPITEEARQRLFDPEWRKEVVLNSKVANFSKQSKRIINTISSMQLVVARPYDAYKQFIVASQPVVRFESFPRQILGTEGVELWTTLTPFLAVGFVAVKSASAVIYLSNQDVHKINTALTKQSSSIAGPSKSLVETLGKRCW